MNTALVIHGRIENKAFIPDDPLPDVEGRAELIVYTRTPARGEPPEASIFDFCGKAAKLRSAEDIDAQIADERSAWNDT